MFCEGHNSCCCLYVVDLNNFAFLFFKDKCNIHFTCTISLHEHFYYISHLLTCIVLMQKG